MCDQTTSDPFWVKGRPGDVHVRPTDESMAHRVQLDGICWCQPSVYYEDPVSGVRVILHREEFC